MLEATLYAFLSVFAVSIISLIGILAISVNEWVLRKIIFVLVGLAVGALLGGAFIHLIPEAFEESTNTTLTAILIIAGIFIFLVLEKFLHWHHAHGEEKEEKQHKKTASASDKTVINPVGYMILASDGLHNLIDGILIGVSYMASIEIGIATTIAVILHEIPQEIGDFGVLIHAGFSKMRALLFNFLSALFAILGLIVALLLGEISKEFVTIIIPLAAGGFIYIAAADLIPGIQKTKKISRSLVQLAAIIVGVAIMLLI